MYGAGIHHSRINVALASQKVSLLKLMSGRRVVVTRRRAAPAKRAGYAPAQKRITGLGAYKAKAAGGGGKYYYEKYKAAKAAARPAVSGGSGGWLSPALSAVGGALLPGIGGPIGAGLGSLVKQITGFGDYEVKQNALMKDDSIPEVVNVDKHGGVVIRHKEYLGDIVTSGTANTFNLSSYPLQPGSILTHPWLGNIAANFQEYSYEGLAFEFRSMSADALNSVNTALGQVIMATNYNAASPNFGSKGEMENSEFSQSTKPACSAIHYVECEPRKTAVSTMLYVRTGVVADLPSGTDIRLYDWGNFQIATNGFQGTSVNVGELWVTYQVSLSKPILPVDNSGAGTTLTWSANGTGGSAGTPLNSVVNVFDNIGVTTTGTTLTFPAPAKIVKFQLSYYFTGGSGANVAYWNISVTNGTSISNVFGANSQVCPNSATASNKMMFCQTFQTDGTGNPVTVTFGGSATCPTGSTTQIMFMSQISR